MKRVILLLFISSFLISQSLTKGWYNESFDVPGTLWTNALEVLGGTPGVGKVLTDDGTGLGVAIWSAAAGGGANTALSNLASVAINTSLILGASDGGALGSVTKQWSDLFLASGGVINWNNGDMTITHAANVLDIEGGKVGIGTASPTETLTIVGTTSDTPGEGMFGFSSASSNQWIFRTDVTNGDFQLDREFGGAGVYFNVMTFDRSSGNVGIGVADPDSKLKVNGTGHFTGIVTLDNNLTVSGTTVNMVTSGTTLTVGVGVNNGTVSAGIFTDRTPFYDGDALLAIKNIKGINGQIDHQSLPEFVKVYKTKDKFEKQVKRIKSKDAEGNDILDEFGAFFYEDELDSLGGQVLIDVKIGTEETIERNIGNMISVSVKALQQLITINEDLTTRIEALEVQ